jgi:hypothetical protein
VATLQPLGTGTSPPLRPIHHSQRAALDERHPIPCSVLALLSEDYHASSRERLIGVSEVLSTWTPLLDVISHIHSGDG